MLREVLAGRGRHVLETAALADEAVIARAHDPEYVRRFLEGSIDARVMRRIGFPWSEGLVVRTLASVGATLAATEDALGTGFGGALAGGTHHALRGEGAGFCVFNDIAVSVLNLRATGGVARVAVIDLDVHQGDGTASIFEGDEAVFTLSLHGANNFPIRKQRSTVDVAFEDGTGDEEYLAALARVLPSVFAFAPRLVFYQSGVDGLAGDSLGRLALTHAGLAERDRMVFTACRARGVPVVTLLGGGYSEPIDLTVQAHAQTFLIAADVFGSD